MKWIIQLADRKFVRSQTISDKTIIDRTIGAFLGNDRGGSNGHAGFSIGGGFSSIAVGFGLLVTLLSSAIVSAQQVDFNREIRPILTENCYACHGPDANTRAADLRLDVRDSAIEMQAIVPGDVDSSELMSRVLESDADLIMPPPESHKKLTSQQIDKLRQWIAEGAKFAEHWSFAAPIKAEISNAAGAWARQPWDHLVWKKLQSMGLTPATEADLATLIRRVTLDLTGLPPDWQTVERVLNDPAADRYERYVDELLNNPRWGEHRARYWLDYARYADTHGIHFDNYREIWAYRDWVIEAFNRNLPFDQFTIEQLAGDLLPQPSLDQLIATGFNRCNITTNEGGVIAEEYNVLYTRDRVETTSLVWMGLTTGCAVCHDHKYDPLSQREFYEMAAFFHNTTQPVMDGNIKDTPPIIRVPLVDERDRYAELKQLVSELQTAIARQRNEAQQPAQTWLKQNLVNVTNELSASMTEGLIAHIPLDDGAANQLAWSFRNQVKRMTLTEVAATSPGITASHAWVVPAKDRPTSSELGDWERDQPFTVSFWVKPATLDGALIARMEEKSAYRGWDVWLQGGFPAMHLINRWPENALKVVATDQRLTAGQWHHVAISYDGTSRPEGIKIFVDGKTAMTKTEQNSLSETIRTTVPFRLGSRHETAAFVGTALQEILFYDRVLSTEAVVGYGRQRRQQYLASKPWESLNANEQQELVDTYLLATDASFPAQLQQLGAMQTEQNGIETRGTIAHVMNERPTPPRAHVLFRGEYDQRRDEVSPETPDVLPTFQESFPRNRLGLAQWLVDERHPLTARVTVNRFWQEIFGRGLVATAGDFGLAGQMPSNPELLDYLAVSFREQGWDVKQFFRELVTSATYRQSAQVTAEKLQLDPQNEFLSRGPRYRMDAEMVRDYALAVSGLLSGRIGGPSVRPYQPPGVWEAVAMPESNTRNYRPDSGESLYRRSMYTFWKRAAPPASMEIMNAPNREVCTVQRERTNTPLQALLTLNDPQFIEAARILAGQLLMSSPAGVSSEDAAITVSAADEIRMQELARKLLSREFVTAELEIVKQSLAILRAQYQSSPAAAAELTTVGEQPTSDGLDRPELAAWTMLINQLMNLDEVLNK